MSSEIKYRFDLSKRPHQFLDKSILQSAPEIFNSYSHSLIMVLDFALRSSEMESKPVIDGQGRFLASKYDFQNRVLLNIDHHNEYASRSKDFSTTHQVISAIGEAVFNPTNNNQMVLVNHDDTDSVLSLLLSTHGGVPSKINTLFAEAAKAADHTGVSNRLVNLIDSFYKTYDLDHLVPLINALIYDEQLVFSDEKIHQKFEKYETQPQLIEDYLSTVLKNEESQHGKGFYDVEAKILLLSPNDKAIDTNRVLPITHQMGLPVSIVMIYSLVDPETDWWKISLRAGPNFPGNLTLEEMAKHLTLEQFGYGGRRDAGGMGRYHGEKTISPEKLFDLLHSFLLGVPREGLEPSRSISSTGS